MNKYTLFSLQDKNGQYVAGLHQENSVNDIAVVENGMSFLREKISANVAVPADFNNNDCGDCQNQNQEIQSVSVLFVMKKNITGKILL